MTVHLAQHWIQHKMVDIVWELDFYSRPLVDEKQKKVWEVLICESANEVDRRPDSLFRFAKYCSSTEVNSGWLRDAIEEAIAQAPKPPSRVRFFRRQMNNMITKACQDANLAVISSRRTIALHQWIQQRMAEVYPQLPNYSPTPTPLLGFADSIPQALPDALQGQRWAFVTLNASAFQDFPDWQIDFGDAVSLDLVSLAPDQRIPGLIIFSPRALPLAAWMSGLELAFLKYNPNSHQLILETGANDAWILANLNNPSLQTEAQNFEAAKQTANQVHFLAVQSNPDAQSFTGFWMLQEWVLS